MKLLIFVIRHCLILAVIISVPFFSKAQVGGGSSPLPPIEQSPEFITVVTLPDSPFQGQAWPHYVNKAVIYPPEAIKNTISGIVYLDFLVTKNGTIADVKIVKGLGYGLDEEAIRILKEGPKWRPGILEGRPVDMRRRISMNFSFPVGKSPISPVIRGQTQNDLIFGPHEEVIPEYPGGPKAWASYLKKNLIYPPDALSKQIHGRVIIGFLVTKDGEIKNVKVVRGLGYGTDEEAIRLLKESPKWKPGIRNGKPVEVAHTIPVFFRIEPN